MNATLQTRKTSTRQRTPSLARSPTRLLQRKCACGGTPGPSGECEECRKKRLRGAGGRAETNSGKHAGCFRKAMHDFSRVDVSSVPSENNSCGPRLHALGQLRVGTIKQSAGDAHQRKNLGGLRPYLSASTMTNSNPPRRCTSCQTEEGVPHRLASDSEDEMLEFPRQTPPDSLSTPAPAAPAFPPSPPPPVDCCTQALNAGLDQGDYGGIICCNNAKSVCVWQPNINRVVTNATAQSIVAGCVRVHEATHVNQVDCTGAPVERPSFRQGVDPNASECAAYRVEVPCYQNNIGQCGTDADCRSQVQSELDFARKQVKRFCGSPSVAGGTSGTMETPDAGGPTDAGAVAGAPAPSGGATDGGAVGGAPAPSVPSSTGCQVCARALQVSPYGNHAYIEAPPFRYAIISPTCPVNWYDNAVTGTGGQKWDNSPDPCGKTPTCIDCQPAPGVTDVARCLRDVFTAYANPSLYKLLGPNSNTFAGTLARACCAGMVPKPATLGPVPGWDDPPASSRPAPPEGCPPGPTC
jgi:hypothetical protein